MASGTTISVADALHILRDVAQALAYAHGEGIIHRDVKPENVLLSGGAAVVTDFGIAKAIASSVTAPTLTDVGVSLGTPAYLSPEQASAMEVDARTDVYSWGVVAYELLAGVHPFAFASTSQQLIAAHLTAQPVALSDKAPDVPATVSNLVMACLRKDTQARPANGTALLAALQSAAVARAPFRSRVRVFPAIAIGAAILVSGATLAQRWTRSRSAAPARPTVGVVAFDNQTSDSTLESLGPMAADWLVQGLAGTSLVDVVPLSARRGTRLDDARRVASALRAMMFVSGTYYRISDSVQFQARVIDTRSGNVLAASPFISAPLADPTKALDRLRQRVLGALATQLDPRLAEYSRQAAQPPSFESYQAFTRGLDAFAASRWAESASLLERAYARDSTVARALVLAGVAHLNLRSPRDWAATDSIVRHLQQKHDQLAPADQAFLDWETAMVRGDRDACLAALRRGDSLVPGTFLSFEHGLVATVAHRPREALSALLRVDTAAGEARTFVSYWAQLALAYHMIGRYQDEIRAARQSQHLSRTLVLPFTREGRARIGIGDSAGVLSMADSILNALSPDRDEGPSGLLEMANWATWHGRPGLTVELAHRALAALRMNTQGEESYAHQALVGRAFQLAGQLTDARAVFEHLVIADSARLEYRGALGVIAARLGDRGGAERIIAEIAALRGPYLFADPLRWEDRIAAQLGERDRAVSLLRDEDRQGLGRARLIDGDPDLAVLRGYAAFERLISPKD
jgi:TolB-like protein